MRIWLLMVLVLVCGAASVRAWPWTKGTTAPVAEVSVTREFENGTITREETVRRAVGTASKGLDDYKNGAVSLTDSGISIGGVTVTVSSTTGTKPLYVIGGICIIAGIVIGWLLGWGLGLSISLGGVSLIATVVLFDRYPWFAFVPAVIALVAVCWCLIDLWRGKKAATALKPIVQAVEEASKTTQAEVKELVERYSGKNRETVKDTVTKVKRTINT